MKPTLKIIFSLVFILFISASVTQAQPAFKSIYGDLFIKSYLIVENDTIFYRLLPPKNVEKSKRYPLIVFLHGSGERGNDASDILLKHPGQFFANDTNRTNYPCFVLIPQCRPNSWWSNTIKNPKSKDSINGMYSFLPSDTITNDTRLLIALLKQLSKNKQVDSKRIAIGGISMGAMGTFEMLWRMPNFFSCAYAICGGGSVEKISASVKNMPIKIFHGLADNVVKHIHSQRMYNALQTKGAKVELIEYKNVQHNSWVNAFAEPWLMEWIVKQKRK
jgi:predicted peptidase